MKTPKTLLVVDDDKNLRDLMLIALRSKGYNLLEAQNGREAVDIALKNHPDLILLDLMMPEMDGMTAFKKIREDEWGKSAQVIIMTNLSADEEHLVADIVTNKPLYYLIKADWDIGPLVKKIEDTLASQA